MICEKIVNRENNKKAAVANRQYAKDDNDLGE